MEHAIPSAGVMCSIPRMKLLKTTQALSDLGTVRDDVAEAAEAVKSAAIVGMFAFAVIAFVAILALAKDVTRS